MEGEAFSLTMKKTPRTITAVSLTPWIARWLDSPDTFLGMAQSGLKSKTTLYEQLWHGFLPEAQFLSAEVILDFLHAYQRTYIERDVRLLAEVSSLQLFGRFLQLVSAVTAQEINFSQLGRELGLTPQTSQRWLDILKATFQWFEIPAYSGNLIKRVSRKPKGYIADTGFVSSTQAIAAPATLGGHPLWGSVFELHRYMGNRLSAHLPGRRRCGGGEATVWCSM